MRSQAAKQVKLDKRKSLCRPYSGPRGALGQALRPFMGWVFRHYRYRLSDVTVCYARRDTQELVLGGDPPIEAEFRFDLDRYLPVDIELPEHAEVRDLPAETLIVKSYAGDPEEIMSDMVQWLAEMEHTHRLAPGYRQRYVRIGNDESPDWELDVQLVLK